MNAYHKEAAKYQREIDSILQTAWGDDLDIGGDLDEGHCVWENEADGISVELDVEEAGDIRFEIVNGHGASGGYLTLQADELDGHMGDFIVYVNLGYLRILFDVTSNWSGVEPPSWSGLDKGAQRMDAETFMKVVVGTIKKQYG